MYTYIYINLCSKLTLVLEETVEIYHSHDVYMIATEQECFWVTLDCITQQLFAIAKTQSTIMITEISTQQLSYMHIHIYNVNICMYIIVLLLIKLCGTHIIVYDYNSGSNLFHYYSNFISRELKEPHKQSP